jgi:hypothetical protein
MEFEYMFLNQILGRWAHQQPLLTLARLRDYAINSVKKMMCNYSGAYIRGVKLHWH